MKFQFNVASTAMSESVTPQSAPSTTDISELLRQMLETQREQLHVMKQRDAANDAGGRWRAFLDRWKDDFSGVPEACHKVLPHLERAYINLIAELAAHLDEEGNDGLGNEFALADFLDRYGVRLNQLGSILSVVGPLAEIAAGMKK